MSRSRHLSVTLALLVAGCVIAWPAGAQAPEGGSEPRLYTNADLERHAAPGSPSPPVAPEPGSEAGWEFVADHLERQYRQIEIDREAALERSLVEAEPAPAERGATAVRGWHPWSAVPVCSGPGSRYVSWCHGQRQRPRPRSPEHGVGRGRDRITPLHARDRLVPMPTTQGKDAVPRREN